MKPLLTSLLSVLLMPAAIHAADRPATRPVERNARPVELTAHRGESHDAPENTLAAYKLAWSRGVKAAELDVHLTRDGQLLLIHDKDTERTSGKKQKLVVKDETAETLRKIDVGSWKDPKFAGETMPTLDEALATIPDGARMFVEVKVGPEAVPELVKCFARSGKSPEQLVVIAFNLDTCREAKKALPKHKVFFLSSFKQNKETKEWTPTGEEIIAKAKSAGVDGVDVQAAAPFDGAFVKAARAAGLEVYAWTVDDPARAKQLVEYGVDGITTNRAEWMRGQVEGTR